MRDISKSKTNKIASKHLGSSGSYNVETDKFDSTLLVMIPRQEARKDWDIVGTEFVGYDIWHCHESTFLLDNGMPIAGTLKFVYPSYSEGVVESKSMKLYLNSFDMCKMGKSISFAIENYKKQVKKDLEELLGVEVEVGFHGYGSEIMGTSNPLLNYTSIESVVDISQLPEFDDYKAKEHYSIVEGMLPSIHEYSLKTNVLRSRCRHTKQKDTGTFFGYFKGRFELDEVGLFQKIVSLRMLDEFHEFCCEKLFVDMKAGIIDHCMIALLYSRRGSLDINPIRATSFDIIPKDLINVNILTTKTLGQ